MKFQSFNKINKTSKIKKINKKKIALSLMLSSSIGSTSSALAAPDSSALGTLPLAGVLNSLSKFLTPDITNATIKTIGIVLDHRPFEPATPLGTHPGVDFGMEVDVIQIPDSVNAAFAAHGMDVKIPPILPGLKVLNFHKGLSDKVDFGASFFFFMGYSVWAVELKAVVFEPEEGPTWAIRLSRNAADIPIGEASMNAASFKVGLTTVTYTPELVISKKLDFADPYFGVGYQYVTGTVKAEIKAGPLSEAISPKDGKGGSFLSFFGLSLKVPNFGLRLTLEGAYSVDGYNSLGTKVGFSF